MPELQWLSSQEQLTGIQKTQVQVLAWLDSNVFFRQTQNILHLQAIKTPCHTLLLQIINLSWQWSSKTSLQPSNQSLYRRAVIISGEKAHPVTGCYHVFDALALFIDRDTVPAFIVYEWENRLLIRTRNIQLALTET